MSFEGSAGFFSVSDRFWHYPNSSKKSEPALSPRHNWGQFGYRKLLYFKGFSVPGMSTPVLSVSVCTTVKNKGKDCSTINGHDESASIQSLRKDAREVLVRLSDTYILYNRQIGLTGSNRLSLTSCRLDGYTATSYFGWLKAA